MEVDHVLGVRVESPQVLRRNMLLQLLQIDLVEQSRVLMSVGLTLIWILLANELEGEGARDLPELKAEQVAQPLLEVSEVASDPRLILQHLYLLHVAQVRLLAQAILKCELSHGLIVQVYRPDHEAGVLARELIGRLPQVHRHEHALPPELEQLLGQPEGSAHVVDLGRLPLRQLLQDREDILLGLKLLTLQARILLVVLGLGSGLPHPLVLFGLVELDVVEVAQLVLVVVDDQLHRLRAIPSALGRGVRGDTDHPDAREAGEVLILVLLRNGPGDHVARGAHAPLHLLLDRCLVDLALEADLDRAEDVGQAVARGRLGLAQLPEEDKDVVGGRIGEQLEVVGRVLVVGGDEDAHDLAQELLGGAVVRKQGVPIHVVEVALARVREAPAQGLYLISGVEAEETIEPLLNGVANTITNWLV
mmetsp:Transcript_5564/g.9536  ORF Transcript_5564/g.9536 Transcript_5564/m.9536 type:complete len:420 (-) Transcript_5564:1416-2675(-)